MKPEEEYLKLNKLDDNWLYRYRGASALSLKEIIYNEIYFAYPDELNDPLDLGAELIINKDENFVYEFFLSDAFQSIHIPRNEKLPENTKKVINEISRQYSKKTRNIKELFLRSHKTWLKEQLHSHDLKVDQFDRLYNNLINIISNLLPSRLSSVSFSKNCKNPLLWSVYAEKHSGFCMIFSPSKDMLKIKESNNEDYKEFKIHKVNYSSDIDVDLSLMFNKEKEFDWDALDDKLFPELIKKALLTKNTNWYKESEFRIFKNISMCFSHLPKYLERKTSFERTCYFAPSQLVGVIFGYKMAVEKRNEIIKIFENKKQSSKIFEAFPAGNEIEVELVEIKGFFE